MSSLGFSGGPGSNLLTGGGGADSFIDCPVQGDAGSIVLDLAQADSEKCPSVASAAPAVADDQDP